MRAWVSSSGNAGLSQYVGGGCLGCLMMLLSTLGVIGIAALIYSLT